MSFAIEQIIFNDEKRKTSSGIKRIENEKKAILDSLPTDVKDEFADLSLEKLKVIQAKLIGFKPAVGVGNADDTVSANNQRKGYKSDFIITK